MASCASKNIKAINKDAVHRICSGQVVLNLAVAVKELVENSLDAGASVVEVRLREYGSELIEVSDNGSGVEVCNFQGLTLKHHTSKLQDFSDLVSVETFGFRGEALSSLCSLSDVTVTSRHHTSDCGTKLVFDHNGQITSTTSVARKVGTTVTLENIFSTLPVRQKEFHRNLKREFAKMSQLLYAYCLVCTGVRITCTNQTKKGGRMTVASTQACKTVRENIACVFGTKQLSSLLELKSVPPTAEMLEQLNIKISPEDQLSFTLDGLVSSCAHGQGRSTNDRQFYFVNSRPCEPTKVVKAVNEVYHQYNMHQQPFVYLNISSARDSVDVNVTPDKRQVFLEHEKLLVATVKSSLLALYENIPSTYSVNNIQSPKTNNVSSSLNTSSSSPASILSQWRHSSAGKRPSSEQPAEKLSKQAKLDSLFSKRIVTQAPINGFVKHTGPSSDNLKPSLIDSESQSKITNYHIEEISLTSNHHVSKAETKMNCVISEVIEDTIISDKVSDNISVEDRELSQKSESQVSFLSDLSYSSSGKYSDSGVISNEYNERNKLSQESLVDKTKEESFLIKVENSDSFQTVSDSKIDHQTKTDTEDLPIVETETLDSVVDSARADVASSAEVKFDSDDPYTIESRQVMEIPLTMDILRENVQQGIDLQDTVKESKVKFRAVIDPNKNAQAEQELNREISKDMFAKMEVVGQFNKGFIIAKLDSDLFIVDQHATDEKYNFETLQHTTTLSSQKLVVPQPLELTAVNEAILIDSLEIFKANGFELAIDENAPTTAKVKLTSIPMSRNWTFGKEDIDELLFMLQDAPNTLCRPSRVRAMFASRACRKSVMIGTALSPAEMKRLLTHMGEIEQPWNCPHGRPTMRHLVNLDFI